jgi:hypothetical protein
MEVLQIKLSIKNSKKLKFQKFGLENALRIVLTHSQKLSALFSN